jgi:DNA invertase Pin-like site-specific DNA recombinase
MSRPLSERPGYREGTGADELQRDLNTLDKHVEQVSAEKVSGFASKHPVLERVLDDVDAGDTPVATKLDRLARSTLDLLRIIDRIEKEGAGFKSVGDPWADTTTPHGKLMLTVLGGIAEFERSLILQRTNEGRVHALADGVRFGRKPKLTKHQAREALNPGGEGARAAARDCAELRRSPLDNLTTQGTTHLIEGRGFRPGRKNFSSPI